MANVMRAATGEQPAPAWRRAVVTGAAGFIGSHLVRALERQGIEVAALDRAPQGGRHITVDLSRPGALDAFLDDATAVFHMAGSADVPRSVVDPVADFSDNVTAMIAVLEAARRTGCAALVLPSTGSVYDTNLPAPYAETAPTRPSSPYGAAKLACEAYCIAYARSYELPTRIARLFSVYGPGMRRFAIHDFHRRLRKTPSRLALRGDGGQTRDYLFVEDAANALIRIATTGAPGEIFNVASGEPRRMVDVARAVAWTMGLDGCTIEPDGAAIKSEVYRMEADVTRLRQIGFASDVAFADGLRRTVEWMASGASETIAR